MVECSDHTYYTGWTNDLEKRVRAHNAGRGARYTKPRRPVRLVYFEEFDTKEQAMRREWEIKQMSRAAKERLLEVRKNESDTGTAFSGGHETGGPGV